MIDDGSAAEIQHGVVEVALAQYANQWSRIGNRQTSAGAVLTVISIAMSIGISNVPECMDEMQSVSPFSIGFALSVIMSVVYFVLSACFMIPVLLTKTIHAVKAPAALSAELATIMKQQQDDVGKAKMGVIGTIIGMLDKEVCNLDGILERNGYWYGKSLVAAFLSLGSSVTLLLFVKGNVLSSLLFQWSFVGLFGYAFALGIVLIFIFPSKTKKER